MAIPALSELLDHCSDATTLTLALERSVFRSFGLSVLRALSGRLRLHINPAQMRPFASITRRQLPRGDPSRHFDSRPSSSSCASLSPVVILVLRARANVVTEVRGRRTTAPVPGRSWRDAYEVRRAPTAVPAALFLCLLLKSGHSSTERPAARTSGTPNDKTVSELMCDPGSHVQRQAPRAPGQSSRVAPKGFIKAPAWGRTVSSRSAGGHD